MVDKISGVGADGGTFAEVGRIAREVSLSDRKVLAIIVQGTVLCARCALDLAHASGYPHLFLSTVPTKEVAAKGLCWRCGYRCGGIAAYTAAAEITKLLKQGA